MCRGRVRISVGFVVLLALLFYLDRELGLLGPGIVACVFHELGHIGAAYFVGGSVKGLHLSVVGAELILNSEKPLSYGKELIVALAGPLSSFLCAFIAAKLGAYLLAGMCLGQGAFNVLPVLPLDGGRGLYALIAMLKNDGNAESTLTVVSMLLVGALFGLGGILLRQYGNTTMMITAGWLFGGVLRRRKEEKFIKSEKMLA